jgi:hypothetical protein
MLREYPIASFRDVTAPNADTLYTTAFFDVGREPWVSGLPDMKDRYNLVPMLGGPMCFRSPENAPRARKPMQSRDPGWKGTLPASVKAYKSPASLVWLLGRIYSTGNPEDYAAVLAGRSRWCL